MKALVLTLILAAGWLLPSGPTHAAETALSEPPMAHEGVIDLGSWPLARKGPVPLAGQWEFFWGQLLAPADFVSGAPPSHTGWFSMPSVWNGTIVDGRELDGRGAATFRLMIQIDSTQGRLALMVPYAFTAYRLWVDDHPAAVAGHVGPSAGEMQPAYRTRIVFIEPPADGRIVLTLQISNFMHAKGGMRAPLRLVAASQVPAIKYRAIAKDVLVFGCLLIMSIYHLFLFAFRPSDRFNLYFALCCLLFGLRASLTGEVFLVDIFPSLSWHVAVRLEWLCVYVGAPLCIAFIHALFPRECAMWMDQGGLAAGLLLTLVTLLAPPQVFTGMFPYMTPLIGLMLGYCVWVVAKAAIHRRFGAVVMMVCLLLVIATVINDMLYANDLIQTGYAIPYGMLFFVFSQAMILANRSSKAFRRLETTNAAYQTEISERERAETEVRAYRDHLEDLVRERTDALAVVNRQLRQELDERQAAEAEKSRLQNRLQRAQKMEALGTLAGGVAHDLNNILSGLVGYPDLLLQDLPADSDLRKPMQIIQQSGQKAAAIVQDLLTLARRGVADFQALDFNRVVTDYLESPEFDKLIQFHPTVRVSSDLSPDLMTVRGSAVHLFKTVMNLVSNAAEAMPDGGAIRIRTANQYVDRPIGDYTTVEAGDYVVCRVQDEGIGISKADMERIFEPFYTKKVMGKSGTGLGMAVVWGTVKDHHGYIDINSREGVGSTFTLYFPAIHEKPQVLSDAWSLIDHRGCGQTILIVDDVAEQRDIAGAMLTRLGYRVETVASGEAAVDHVADRTVDLLLLDMIMDPGIDGLETYRRILAIHPGQRAVIASGFAETARVHEAQRLGAAVYLKKPYRLETLAAAIKSALDRQPQPAFTLSTEPAAIRSGA